MDADEIEQAFIMVDSADDLMSKTLHFLVKVLGKQYFQIVVQNANQGMKNSNTTETAKVVPDSLCHLPVLHLLSQSFVHYAGLCTVVRKMVHHVEKSNPQSKVISLLVSSFQDCCSPCMPIYTIYISY